MWEYKQIPAMVMPAHVKVSEDHSKYYLKTPQDMSRFEIGQLEQMLREIDEPDEFIPDEEMYASEEFKDLKAQMLAIQPIRHGMIKKYFDKFKYQKKKRELLLKLVDDSEEQAQDILGPSGEFVPFREAIPEIKTFLAEVEAREKLQIAKEEANPEEAEAERMKRQKIGSKEGVQVEEISFDPERFNPFDRATIKREEKQEEIKPHQARKVLRTSKRK